MAPQAFIRLKTTQQGSGHQGSGHQSSVRGGRPRQDAPEMGWYMIQGYDAKNAQGVLKVFFAPGGVPAELQHASGQILKTVVVKLVKYPQGDRGPEVIVSMFTLTNATVLKHQGSMNTLVNGKLAMEIDFAFQRCSSASTQYLCWPA